MKLTDILTAECVKVPLEAKTKEAAITELIDLLNANGTLSDRDVMLRAVLEREQTRTTGIGHGLAVPHGKAHGCNHLVMAVGKPAEPIDFQSIDKQPVQVVVLLASPPDQTGPHIQALARISRLMTMEKFRTAMFKAGSAEELYGIIAGHEG
ncbi:MAG: PTS sugar transporter subunit IIA [Phycisphaerae bacterium]|nr:PTS sugar transporter subunit IIA [Phycisphaerae bacterium]